MKIISLNLGKTQHYAWRNGTDSAILKSPVVEAVTLTEFGLQGDEQADLNVHGGQDKAVLCIPESNYSLFEIDQGFGFLGENLTLSRMDESQVQVGDQLQIGEVLLEVSQPRSPCWKLNEITHVPQFLRRYAESGRVGFYCRVLQSGKLKVMQSFNLVASAVPSVSIQTLFLAKHRLQTRQPLATDADILRIALNHPALSHSWKQELTGLLEKATDVELC